MRRLVMLAAAIPLLASAATYHSITVDGNLSEWDTSMERWTTSTWGKFGYITWDADSLYIAYEGININDNGGYNQAVFVAIDTDPMPGLDDGAGGTSLPYEQWFAGSAVHLPFRADLLYSAKAFAGAPEKHVWQHTEGGWFRDGAGGTPDLRDSYHVAWVGSAFEMAIPREHFDRGSHIHLVMYAKDLASPSNPGWGWLYAAVPDNGTSDGINDKTFSHFYGFRLGPGIRPNDGIFYDAAQGHVFWTGDPPGPNSLIPLLVRDCAQGGNLHWGVNAEDGAWTQPIQAYWPEGSVPAGPSAIESPLSGPDAGGVCALTLGPFNTGAQLVFTVDFVIHWNDGSWDNNAGRDYEVALWFLPRPGEPSVTFSSPSDGASFVQGDTVTVSWSSSGASETTLWVDGVEEAGGSPYEWVTDTAGLGRHLLVVQATNEGGLVAFDSRWVWVTPTVEEETPPAGASPGAHDNGDGTVTFMLWAPGKHFVTLLGDFNSWDEDATLLKVYQDSVWWATLPLSSGSYEYRFLVDGTLPIADPYARRVAWTSNGVPSGDWRIARAVVDVGAPAFPWTDASWTPPPPESMIIYEVHLGDFSPSGGFEGLQARLPYLASLGVNAVELMPCYEFPGAVSWGYNPAFYFAPESSYGTPEDLKRLVDAAHARGIAIILDMVFNHMDASSPLYRLYGTNWDESPWFHAMPNPWGFPDLDHWRAGTKQLTKDVLEFWMDEYHLDGFRYDATAFIGWDGIGDDTGNGIGYFTYVAWNHDHDVYQVLEHLPQDPAVITGTKANSGWHDTFHDQMKANLREGQFEGCTFGNMDVTAQAIHYAGDGFTAPTQVVNYTENHDEQRVIWEAQTNPAIDYALAVKKARLGAVVLFTATGIPMIYQGQEFGEDSERTIDPNPLHWEYLDQPVGQSVFRHFWRLIWLRRNYPSLTSGNLLTVVQDNANHAIAYWRWAEGGTDSVVVVVNFDQMSKTVSVPFPVTGTWYEFLGDSAVWVSSSPRSIVVPGSEARVYCRRKRWEWDTTPPAAPTGIMVTPAPGQVTLTWEAVTQDSLGQPETVAYYEVFRATSAYFVASVTAFVGSTTGTVFVDASPPDGPAYYRIRACDASGNRGELSDAHGRFPFTTSSPAGRAR